MLVAWAQRGTRGWSKPTREGAESLLLILKWNCRKWGEKQKQNPKPPFSIPLLNGEYFLGSAYETPFLPGPTENSWCQDCVQWGSRLLYLTYFWNKMLAREKKFKYEVSSRLRKPQFAIKTQLDRHSIPWAWTSTLAFSKAVTRKPGT